MLAKERSKNQLALLKDVVKDFPDVEYFDVTVKENRIVLSPVAIVPEVPDLKAIREKMEALGVTAEHVGQAVKWARKRRNP